MMAALFGALLVGLTLGVLGSGGSMLTVPILRVLVGQPEKVAIAGSLAVVGVIALVGSLPYLRRRMIDWPSVLFFGLPGMVGSYGGAAVSKFVSGEVQMVVFALAAVTASVFLFRSTLRTLVPTEHRRAIWKICLDGLMVGAFTGFVGVGGGFLIVPALVILGGLPMNRAVGTSLLLIAMNSSTGFWKYLQILPGQGYTLDWGVLGVFAAAGVVGSFAGHSVHTRIPQVALKRGFAGLLIVVGGGMIWMNFA